MTREYRVLDYVRLRGGYVGAELRAMSAEIVAQYAADPQPVRLIFPEHKTLNIQEISDVGDIYEEWRWPLFFRHVNELTIEGNGSTVRQDGGEYTLGQFSKPWGGLKLIDCNDLAINDFYTDGQADLITRDPEVTEQDTHGLVLMGCARAAINNVRIKNIAGGDGILLWYYAGDGDWSSDRPLVQCSFVEATNCIVDGASRNGLSVTAAIDCSFDRCSFVNTGRHNYGAHAPGAGIDIEADRYPGDTGPYEPAERTGRITISRCLISNNVGRTVLCVYERHFDCVVEDCVVIGPDDCVSQYETELTAPGMIVRRNTFWGYDLVFGHTNSSVFEGDDARRYTFEDNVCVVRPGGNSGGFTGPRCDIRRNVFTSRAARGWQTNVPDSDISSNEYHRYSEGFDGLANVFASFNGCENSTIDSNSFATSTDGYIVPGEQFGMMAVQLYGGAPDPTNSKYDPLKIYFARSP